MPWRAISAPPISTSTRAGTGPGLYAYEAVGTANGAIASSLSEHDVESRVDPYAEQVFKTSNAYGLVVSDFIASLAAVTNPTLNLWTGTADADISIGALRPTSGTPTATRAAALSTMYLPATALGPP